MPTSGRLLNIALALVMSSVGGCDGNAASPRIKATPASLNSVLAEARGGETIVLAAGDYGSVTLPAKGYPRRVTIAASGAKFTSLTVRKVNNLTLDGGTVIGIRENNFAVMVDSVKNLTIRNMLVSGARVGIGITRSQDVVVAHNQLDGLRSDGVNIAGSQRVRVERNTCRNFKPIPAIFDPAGKMLRDGDHTDCIQGWSIVGYPPTADVTIVGNRGTGYMQGIFFGNPGQGGYDRLVIRDNRFDISHFHGILVAEARDSQIVGNVVRALPGAKMQNFPYKPITTWIKAPGGQRVIVCGNFVENPRFSDDRGACLAGSTPGSPKQRKAHP